MIAPEQWYEYQRQYQKYGIDMKPQSDRKEKREKRRREKTNPFSREMVFTFGNDRKIMLSMVLIGAIVLVFAVLMTSYAAKITFDINKAKAQNDVIMGEIEDLDVKILSTSNICYIESQAKNKLGMKNAGKNCVYIAADEVPDEGFAEILKDKAYNN